MKTTVVLLLVVTSAFLLTSGIQIGQYGNICPRRGPCIDPLLFSSGVGLAFLSAVAWKRLPDGFSHTASVRQFAISNYPGLKRLTLKFLAVTLGFLVVFFGVLISMGSGSGIAGEQQAKTVFLFFWPFCSFGGCFEKLTERTLLKTNNRSSFKNADAWAASPYLDRVHPPTFALHRPPQQIKVRRVELQGHSRPHTFAAHRGSDARLPRCAFCLKSLLPHQLVRAAEFSDHAGRCHPEPDFGCLSGFELHWDAAHGAEIAADCCWGTHIPQVAAPC